MGGYNLIFYKQMSENFLRVKRDILLDMKEISFHTQESWANIMLKHTQYLTTEEDQISFWNFILNPSDERGFVPPKYEPYDPMDVTIQKLQTFRVDDDEKTEEITLQNKQHREGMTMYIDTRQIE